MVEAGPFIEYACVPYVHYSMVLVFVFAAMWVPSICRCVYRLLFAVIRLIYRMIKWRF